MHKLAGLILAAGLLAGNVAAEELHVSNFGQIMTTIPWAVALEKNLFKENGVDITGVISSLGGGTTLRNMLGGGLPFADAAAGATIAAMQAGLPIKIVGASVNTADDIAWVVLSNSPIQSMKDLTGRKFGTTSPGGVVRIFGESLLRGAGVDLAHITQVPLSPGVGIAALDSGAVDATYMQEPMLSKFDKKYRVIGKASDFLVSVSPNVLVASQRLIDTEPDKLRAILRAYKSANEFIYSHPKEAARFASKWIKNVDEASLLRAIERMNKANYWTGGAFKDESIAGTKKLLILTGDLKPDFDFNSAFDRRFLPK